MPPAKLATYRAKRDFRRSAEPRGAGPVTPAEYPRFVVQKHAARRLHFDLRLEIGGVFKSWAVTRGPSLDPADKRLAVEVEDHPLEYGDFEGTIPAGEYGGGSVMIWDRGFWLPDDGAEPTKALREGELKLTLAGERLKGGWVLVRMKRDRDGGGRTNWLLIKHRDGYERPGECDLASDRDRSVASGRTMREIAEGKGRGPKPFMRAGGERAGPGAIWHAGRLAERTRAEVSGLRSAAGSKAAAPRAASGPPRTASARLPDFVSPQLCSLVSQPPDGPGWAHEVKLDGYRMQLRIESGRAALRTRNGLDWTTRFGAIAAAASKLPDGTILDGEAVVLDARQVSDFSALQEALSNGRGGASRYLAFDLLFLEGRDLRKLPLRERKAHLEKLIEKPGAPLEDRIGYVGHIEEKGSAVLASARRLGLEGVVSKRLDAPYVSARAATWTKSKCRAGQEVVVAGWSGGKDRLRSLLVGIHRDGRLVSAGRVGTGFNARNTPRLLQALASRAVAESPFEGPDAPRRQPDWTWVRPELVAEIELAGWTGAGQVRQASFKGLREDKPAREITLERPAMDEQPASPRRAGRKRPAHNAASASDPAELVVLGIPISKPDKALWPAEGDTPAITKLDLARYLEAVGPWLIRHIEGRPCSLVRAPDGISGQQFFQRHAMPGISSLVTLVDIEGDRNSYVQIDSVEALISVAQLAALELHPWNCAPHEPERPGRLVFDLDPGPGVPFERTISAARELKDRLETLRLVPFCKTTGGKGLHVVVPLKAGRKAIGWDEAKTFAQAVCAAMAADSPDRYLINMSKRRRQGRIFLDYLRNDRMATAVAPLSPRARPGATISMPLTWTQVRSGLDPARFTVLTTPPLLARTKAWQDYEAAARPLADAIARLVKEGR